ncbi:hypothetical protein GCM10027168_64900 [Streptomyces capparidis]
MRAFSRARALTVSGSLAAAVALTGLAASPAAAAATIGSGHVDVLDAEFDGGFHLHVHDESATPDVEYDPADVVLDVKPAARTTRPSGTVYDFLGAAGSTVWVLPQSEATATSRNVIWPGISTEHLATGVLTNNRVTYTLTGAQYDAAGDGTYEDSTAEFSVYGVSGSGTVTKYYDGGNGLGSADARSFAVGGHFHYNWAFEQAGTYRLTFRVSGTLTSNGTTPSHTESYVFTVRN